MKSLLENPKFQALFKSLISRHEMDVLIGQEIRESPELLNSFPEVSKESIVRCLIATCISEEEIRDVLLKSGFNVSFVSILKEASSETEKEDKALSIAIGANLTKDGRIAIATFLPDEWLK